MQNAWFVSPLFQSHKNRTIVVAKGKEREKNMESFCELGSSASFYKARYVLLVESVEWRAKLPRSAASARIEVVFAEASGCRQHDRTIVCVCNCGNTHSRCLMWRASSAQWVSTGLRSWKRKTGKQAQPQVATVAERNNCKSHHQPRIRLPSERKEKGKKRHTLWKAAGC